MSTRYPAFDGSQNCARRDINPAWFFPAQGSYPHSTAVKAICTGELGGPVCPFLQPCLEYALTYNVDGCWAGTFTKERQRMRRKLGIVAQPVPVPGWLGRAS